MSHPQDDKSGRVAEILHFTLTTPSSACAFARLDFMLLGYTAARLNVNHASEAFRLTSPLYSVRFTSLQVFIWLSLIVCHICLLSATWPALSATGELQEFATRKAGQLTALPMLFHFDFRRHVSEELTVCSDLVIARLPGSYLGPSPADLLPIPPQKLPYHINSILVTSPRRLQHGGRVSASQPRHSCQDTVDG